ncbi:unnamed protein product, partial [Pylaiella littoralis]
MRMYSAYFLSWWHPGKARLQFDTNSGEFIDPSTAPASPADITMATRTSVPHFAELLRDQNVTELVRITPFNAATEYGHLVALGPDGFFLCTCLRLLIEGLCCRHGLKAMQNKDIGFHGACITPRWCDSGAAWTMAALAAKPARLTAAVAGGSLQLAPVDMHDDVPDVFSHPEPTVRSRVFANLCTLGKELATMAVDRITTVEGAQRIVEIIKKYAVQVMETEERSQNNASATRIFSSGPAVGSPGGRAAGRGDTTRVASGGRGARGGEGTGGPGGGAGGAEGGGAGEGTGGAEGGGAGGGRRRRGGGGHRGGGRKANCTAGGAGLPASQPVPGAAATTAAPGGLNAIMTGGRSPRRPGAPFSPIVNAAIDACRHGGGQPSQPL